MAMKREYLFAGLVVIIVALSVAWGQVRTTEAKLSDLRWGSNAPQFIIENSAKKNQFTGPLLIKLTSGKDQFISGDWKLAFSGSEIYGFGNFAKSTSTADTNSTSTSIFSPHTGPYLMRIADDTINIIEEKDLGAPIAEGSHSLNNSYFGVRLQNDRHTFCVIELTEDRKDHPCQSVPIEKDDQVMWSPTTDHQLIVQSATGTVTTIDVWDGKEMKKTEPATANLRYQYHRNIAEIQTKPALEMHRYWDILAVKQPNGWKAFHIPSGSHATLLSDNNHLLITEKNSLSILEISTRKIAHLYADNGIGDAQISTRNSNEISL
jgi:hypothetical protein